MKSRKSTMKAEVQASEVVAPELRVAKSGKQWRIEALREAMEAVSHIDEARRLVKHLVQKETGE